MLSNIFPSFLPYLLLACLLTYLLNLLIYGPSTNGEKRCSNWLHTWQAAGGIVPEPEYVVPPRCLVCIDDKLCFASACKTAILNANGRKQLNPFKQIIMFHWAFRIWDMPRGNEFLFRQCLYKMAWAWILLLFQRLWVLRVNTACMNLIKFFFKATFLMINAWIGNGFVRMRKNKQGNPSGLKPHHYATVEENHLSTSV